MKSIHTLIPDIQAILKRKDGWMLEYADQLGSAVADRLNAQFAKEHAPRLRLSQMGNVCPRALWYSVHKPDEAEEMPPWAEVKFSLGHIVEAYALVLAKASGHNVEYEQHELELDGIPGHCDALVDGCLVDVKSTSSRSFQKFKAGTLASDDPFGYLDQLDGYVCALMEDNHLLDKQRGYIIAIDKQLGHMCLYEHTIRHGPIQQRIAERKRVVERSEPPACTCGTINHGASGNIKLNMRASYSAQKWSCFPNLRCFIYADGPVFLTKVVRKPDVLEVDRFGKAIYH